tara:strand:- start:3818 stop:4249 length:432 start_codon:yes stop_codon:yes gene_type:complete
MTSLTTSNMFVENKINVNKDLVELESVDVGEGILSFNFDTNEHETTLVTEKDVRVAEESEVWYIRAGEQKCSLTVFHKVPINVDGKWSEVSVNEIPEGASIQTIEGLRGCVAELQDDHTSGTEVVTLKTESGYYFTNNILVCD